MIRRLITFALHQRFITLALALLLTVGGIVSFYRLPIEAYPDVADVQVDVITLWPGHAAEEVERHITIPLEKELNGVAKITFLRSTSIFGLSNIRVLFADGTDNYWARQQVQERLSQAEIPPDAKPSLGPLSSVIGEVYRYTLESKTMPLVELKALQDWVLEREFRKVPGVVDVVSWGGGIKQYQITVDPARLRAYNLTLKQVFDAVSANNANAGGSYIPQGEYALMVRGIGLIQSTRDIENIVVAAQRGTPVRIRDIGQAGIGHAIRFGMLGRDHEDDLVQGIVLMRKGENPGQVIEGARKKIEEIQKLLPPGVQMRPYYSRDRLVHTTVTTVMRNLIEGAALVILVLSLFLYNLRAACIVAITIPLSLLFAFIFMDLRGIPANLLSLGAIDFGIIVDGAVVMTENILRHLSEHRSTGQRGTHGVQQAAMEVAKPLTFAVLIIMTVYVPILTFQRIEGKLFQPMAVTISLAVIGSLLLTLTVIPVLSTLLFHRPPSERESPLLVWLRRAYLPALRWCIDRPLVPLLSAGGLLLLALLVFAALGKEFLPELDEGDIWLRVKFPVGISLEGARPYTHEIRERLLVFPEVRTVVSQLGAPDDGTDPNGPDNAEFYLALKPREEWTVKNKEALIEAMSGALASIPGITTNFSQPIKDNVDEAMAGVKGELAIKLYGPDLFVLETKAKEIVGVLSGIRGVADLDFDHLVGQPQLQVVVDRGATARYGINVQDVQDAIEAATKGRTTTVVFEGERRFDLAVRLSQGGDPLANVRSLTISAPNGERVPVGQLAEIGKTDGLVQILREGNIRRVAIKWSVRGRDMGSLVAEAMHKVDAAVRLPQGYNMTWSGRFEDQQRALARLYIIVPLVIFIIFILLFGTFQSIGHALLIMLNLPFALIGGTLALYLWHTNFSISAAVGYIAVFGVSVLDGVVLVSWIHRAYEEEGLSLRDAVLRGCEIRFRPIIVTAIVAVIGFLPAALSHGIGAEIQQPLARVVIGGLISSTALTLLVLPAVYALLARRQERRERQTT
ncbi:MAG: efflux RND transporter permease subunit [candidate division NC10 bacterium]|nr:efflux RND transporter permease subunit [candidate division NC10 bacterium]MDE2322729.1 efflux RND transporter permease subunit [candidate division NC10 bacterium]